MACHKNSEHYLEWFLSPKKIEMHIHANEDQIITKVNGKMQPWAKFTDRVILV